MQMVTLLLREDERICSDLGSVQPGGDSSTLYSQSGSEVISSGIARIVTNLNDGNKLGYDDDIGNTSYIAETTSGELVFWGSPSYDIANINKAIAGAGIPNMSEIKKYVKFTNQRQF